MIQQRFLVKKCVESGWLFGLAVFLCLTVSAQNDLQLNQTIEREIKKDETQVFKINAKNGDLIRLVVWQKNADVSLKLASSADEKLVEVDNSDSAEEPERISFIAGQSGEFRLSVSGRKLWKTPNNYELKLDALRPPSLADKSRVAAEKLYNEALSVWFSGKPDAKNLAVKAFHEALPHFQAAEDRFGEAFVYYYLGILSYGLQEPQKSVGFLADSARVFRDLKALPQLALALRDQAAVYNNRLDNLKKAGELSEEALEIYRQLDDKKNITKVGGNLAVIDLKLGRSRQALKQFEEILPIFQADNDQESEGWIFHMIGSTYDDLGESQKSIEFLEKALKIRRKLGNKDQLAETLTNLGSAYKSAGDLQKAGESQKEALEIYRAAGNEDNQTYSLNNLGTIYDDLGDYPQAIEYYEKALELNGKRGKRENQAGTLNNLALLSLKLGDTEKALELQTRSLEIFRDINEGGSKEAMASVNLGLVLQRKGDRQRSLEYFEASLPIFRKAELPDWEANSLIHIGENYYLSGDFQKSFENCAGALEINKKIQYRFGEMLGLLCAAKAESKLSRLADAQAKIERSLTLIEDTRTKINRQDLQASFFATRQDYYEFYIDLLMQRHKLESTKGFDALALQTSERARARNLLESLGKTELREGLSTELLAKEKEARREINRLESLRQELKTAKAANEKIAEIEKEIDKNLDELLETQAKIRSSNPKFANFSQAATLGLTEIQAQVLDENSVLLEYSLGAERSFLFVATRNSLTTYELPKRAEIEAPARIFYESLKARSVILPNESAPQKELRIQKADAELIKKSAELGKILLPVPVAGQIENKKLLIVSPEILQYVPFAVLKNPQSNARFLIETSEIVNLPSASALATLRKQPRPTVTKELLIFADPIFNANDARLRPRIKQNIDLPVRSNYARLRFSREEADKISLFVPVKKRLLATDFKASLANFRKLDLSQYRILHFATHSSLDSRFNELSGVVLSLVDAQGNVQDGFLRLSEIYNLRLNARLVVLSACETALGREIRGEGLVGFTHAFLYSGAKSVVASLWRVEDRATSELMQRFYQAMLKENLPPSRALQKAQISMLKEKDLENPFYWSAFTIQGDN